MKPFDDIIPQINVHAPGLDIPSAYLAIRQAAAEFCERTSLWRVADDFTVTDSEPQGVPFPYGAVVHRLEVAEHDGVPLTPVTPDWLDQKEPGWRDGALTGSPCYLVQLEPGTLSLVPYAAGTVTFSAWLKPSQDAEELPDFMIDLYAEVLAHGALGRLLAQPEKPWTNLQMAGAFMSAFNSKLDTLKFTGSTGQTRARVRTRLRLF